MTQPPNNPLIAALTGQWDSLKARFRSRFSYVQTYFQIGLFFIIFMLLITTGYQYRQVQIVTKEKIRFKDSIRIVDKEREWQIKASNKRIQEMEELTYATQKENTRLQQELNQLQLNKKSALKEIDGFTNEELANWFKGKSLKTQKK